MLEDLKDTSAVGEVVSIDIAGNVVVDIQGSILGGIPLALDKDTSRPPSLGDHVLVTFHGDGTRSALYREGIDWDDLSLYLGKKSTVEV